MKLYYLLMSILVSCTTNHQNPSKCFPDQGIKTAKIEATLLSDKTRTVNGTIHFNKFGSPTIRELADRKIELKYDSINLTQTIIHVKEFDSGSRIDTNIVNLHDELGRALKITGPDGRTTEYSYQNCDEHLEIYKESNGTIIHQFKSTFKNGVLIETLWIPNDNTPERKTIYYDYKFDERGYWIERKYQHANGALIHEVRELEYYN